MDAGALDRLVTIQRATYVQNEYGEEIATWGDLATVYAEVRQRNGREFFAAASTQAEKLVVFFIRYIPGLTVLDRVSYSGSLHNIQEVREIGRGDGIELHTVAAG